jgi:imidazolonepropionase
MNVSRDYGSLEKGKFADAIIVNANRWEHLIYQLGDPPIAAVFKKGKAVYEKDVK